MSMGTHCRLYRPIEPSVVSWTQARCAHDTLRIHIPAIARILTNHCKIETLLWFAVIDLIERALLDERDLALPGGAFAPSLLLSAIRKDGRGKHQTREMKLLHDVVVELGMAEENYETLQAYLREHLGLHIGGRHSCSKDCVRIDDLAAFRHAVRADQLQRTMLDWTHETTVIPLHELDQVCTYPLTQQTAVARIFSRAEAYVASLECASVPHAA